MGGVRIYLSIHSWRFCKVLECTLDEIPSARTNRKERNVMKSTEHGAANYCFRAQANTERAEMEIAHNSGESYSYFREDEIEQPCVYRECST